MPGERFFARSPFPFQHHPRIPISYIATSMLPHTHIHAPNTKPKDVDKLGSGPSISFHSGQGGENFHVHTTSPFLFLHLFPSLSPSSYTAKTFALHSKHVLEHSRRATFVTTHLTLGLFVFYAGPSVSYGYLLVWLAGFGKRKMDLGIGWRFAFWV
ncbi:hypothetical protein K491DRAFT_458493 [Lophiostoma macrostomum CBS 122681]|uniref:Uncharacterized protein n=1 Tax=Lophiostoma macrostomum CBS 122681 TaxID=1314788 RepID=A0A6A6T585_9PLEO|nr:hypothetical protein K491DRAFT_458493 [Lophiostoma macrostomum CBS 122681]